MALRKLYVSRIALPDDALVVRGGTLSSGSVRKSAKNCKTTFGLYGVSAWGGSGVNVQDLVIAGNIFQGFILQTTAGSIRLAGFDIELTMGPRHCTIDLGGFPTDDVLGRLREAFGDFMPNPYTVEKT